MRASSRYLWGRLEGRREEEEQKRGGKDEESDREGIQGKGEIRIFEVPF